MKHIGSTPAGGTIVEFSQDEYVEFLQAQHAANGLTINEVHMKFCGGERISSDMKQFFSAMEAFINAKFRVNEMEKCVNGLKESLNIDKPKEIERMLL